MVADALDRPQSDAPGADDSRSRALTAQLARTQDRYLEWQMAQKRDLNAREMALERLKADIDQRVQTAAMAMANTIAQQELQLAEYAAAIQRAVTGTENPYALRRDAVPNLGQSNAAPAAPQPLRLPGG